ncbi:hypothetical protein J2X15_002321 [Rhodoferax saidenbachensis]|uniref:Uncharacterized protein n=1 Tax=Rhodoferax saidenbachensis TaxID=1484693 RepID=A0ABU1ZNB5_9BURK|nr:hypothetical protein [Rhodoferax saidenbachensis]
MLIFALFVAAVVALLYLGLRLCRLFDGLPRSNADWIYY